MVVELPNSGFYFIFTKFIALSGNVVFFVPWVSLIETSGDCSMSHPSLFEGESGDRLDLLTTLMSFLGICYTLLFEGDANLFERDKDD